jgi:hypothetical protein
MMKQERERREKVARSVAEGLEMLMQEIKRGVSCREISCRGEGDADGRVGSRLLMRAAAERRKLLIEWLF